jgi:hypothetical protein
MLLKTIESGQPPHRTAKEDEPSEMSDVAHFDGNL